VLGRAVIAAVCVIERKRNSLSKLTTKKPNIIIYA